MPNRNQVFISYSHADSDHFARLKVHLRPFERQALVDVWSDTRIEAGQEWRAEIRDAINRAGAAILLVSADFLASDFIAENELPPLLAAAREEGLQIIPVILKPCAYLEISELEHFQAINNPNNPLVALSEADRERLWLNVAKAARDAIPQARVDLAEQPPPFEEVSYLLDPKLTVFLLSEEIRNPAAIKDYIVYHYEHLDTLAYMRDADEVLELVPERDEIIKNVRSRLLEAGWEGDGRIQILWLPPFLGAGVQDTYGVAVWHVKQINNGISWLASPVPLPFERLLDQNRWS